MDKTTLREHLEAIRDDNDPEMRGWVSSNYQNAVAALEGIAELERRWPFLTQKLAETWPKPSPEL